MPWPRDYDSEDFVRNNNRNVLLGLLAAVLTVWQ
jgi:hypothetical protein